MVRQQVWAVWEVHAKATSQLAPGREWDGILHDDHDELESIHSRHLQPTQKQAYMDGSKRFKTYHSNILGNRHP